MRLCDGDDLNQRIHPVRRQTALLTPRNDDADRRVRPADDAERREVARVHVPRHREQDTICIYQKSASAGRKHKCTVEKEKA